MPNKVEYGLKNVHYATIGLSGTAVVYGTPIAIPGAVSLTLSPEGDSVPFYADDKLFFEKKKNGGYSGSIEVARVPESFYLDVLKMKKDVKDIYYEDASVQPDPCALLFEIDGDVEETKFVYYNVLPDRPEEGSETTAENIAAKTKTMNIAARPSDDKDIVKAWHTATTSSDTVSSGWYTTVQLPAV